MRSSKAQFSIIVQFKRFTWVYLSVIVKPTDPFFTTVTIKLKAVYVSTLKDATVEGS